MTSQLLAHDAPIVAVARDADRPIAVLALDKRQRTVLALVIAAVVTAIAAPYPMTKAILGVTLALYWATVLFSFDERFVGMYVLLLPTLQLLPLETLGVPALNWQTIFLIIFAVVAAGADPPPFRLAVSGWITYFSIILILAACHGWITLQEPVWPLLVVVKNWLFPFSLFFLGRRCFRSTQQLWFLLLCVAVVSSALSLQGLREGLMTGNLVTNRPTGLLTGQANLFGGYLAMYALLFLFVSRTFELRRAERLFLTATAFLMVATLLFTLSRGAWLAFVLAAALVGFATNRGVVVLLVLACLVGYRWAPQEAVTRADLTVTAVGEAGDSSLEEALDDSAALRIIQWKSFPTLFLASPIWGTGLGTYAERLGQSTGIFRPAHATMVQIGAEMGALGLLGYAGLFGAVALLCASRARSAQPGTFQRVVGLGLLAATVCLFLLDFSGTRFGTHTVTTYFWLLLGAFLGNTDGMHASANPRSDPRQMSDECRNATSCM